MDRFVVRRPGNRIRRRVDGTLITVRQRRSQRGRKGKVGSISRHKFVRSVGIQANSRLGIDLFSGFTWNGVSLTTDNIQVDFTLNNVRLFAAGGASPFATLPMPNATEFTGLYDQYRIDWIDCQFMFSNNNSSVNSPATVLPIIYLCKDYDDTANATVNDIRQYSTQQTWQLGQQQGSDGIHHVFVKPNVDVALYNGITTGYARGKPMYIDTGSADVPHYGIKFALDRIAVPASSTPVGYLTINFVYHMTFANTK